MILISLVHSILWLFGDIVLCPRGSLSRILECLDVSPEDSCIQELSWGHT